MSEIKLTVEFVIDVEDEREAEKLLDAWLLSAEDDDRLIRYSAMSV